MRSCHFVWMEEKVSREREERDKNHAVLVLRQIDVSIDFLFTEAAHPSLL